MSEETQDRKAAVWEAWNALDGDDMSPVRRLSRQLGMPAADVAAIVFPVDRFGPWDPDDEPEITPEDKPLGLVYWADRLQKISEDDAMSTGLAGLIQEIVSEMRDVMGGRVPDETGQDDGRPEVLMIRTDRDGAKFWNVLKFSYGDLRSTGSPMLDAIRANLNTMGVASIELLPEVTE